VRFGRDLSLVPRSIGYGFGTRERENPPNALRVILAEVENASEVLVELSCNLDDATGQLVGYLVERALELGALDAFAVPTTAKKSRPGHLLTFLCEEGRAPALEELLFVESPTLGVRRARVQRRKLERAQVTRVTSLGPVRYKEAVLPNGERRSLPEYEDV